MDDTKTPDRIWLLWRAPMIGGRFFASEKDHTAEGGYPEYVPAAALTAATARADALAAEVERLTARAEAAEDKLGQCEDQARYYSGNYARGTDGRNTFLIYADWVAALRGDANG